MHTYIYTQMVIIIDLVTGVVGSPMSSARALKLSLYTQSRTILEVDTPSATFTTTTTTTEPLDKWQLLRKIWTQEILVLEIIHVTVEAMCLFMNIDIDALIRGRFSPCSVPHWRYGRH